MIDKDMIICEAIQQKPGCERVFFEFGLHCLGCPASEGETIAQAAEGHGIDLDKLLNALNKFESTK